MLVQLSPWETCSTSVPVSTKRRRKESENHTSERSEERPLELQASFVTSAKRNRLKKRNSKRQEEATIAITSAHRICIVGRSTSLRHQPQNSDCLEECSQWQFRSRPGRTTSFVVPEDAETNGSSDVCGRARVAAVFDARNGKMYALQNENKTLACWNADTCSGPDDVQHLSVKVKLSKPAVSLSILSFQKGVAYGTCQDGSLFVARWLTDGNGNETLRLEYLNTLQTRADHHHVCTIAQASSGIIRASRAGRKRKASTDGEYVFFQVFSSDDSGQLVLYRRDVNLASNDQLLESHVQTSIIDLDLEGTNRLVIDPRYISASQVDDSKIAVVYAAQPPNNGKTKGHQRFYCAPVDLEMGRLIRAPFVLPKCTRHAGAVSPFLLCVGALDEVLLCDIVHGAIVHRAVVTDLVGDCKNWSLVTDSRRGRLALISVQNGHAHVCCAKASTDGMPYQKMQDEGNGYSLAVGLRSSLASSPPLLENAPTSPFHKDLLGLVLSVNEVDSSRSCIDACVSQALLRLSTCIDEIQDPDIVEIQPFQFMTEYERSVISVLSATVPSSSSTKKKNRGTHKGGKRSPLSNGLHHCADASDSTQETEVSSTATKPEEMNGSKHYLVNGLKVPDSIRGYTPSNLPQRFVDGATSLVLSVLQLPQVENKAVGIRTKLARLDARLILSRLIRTGKVSARLHFDPSVVRRHRGDEEDDHDGFFTVLRSLKLTKKGNRRVFSPVDLMHEMICQCPDISESQMVTMIHYMMSKALPEDIAESFLDHGNLKPGHSCRVLAKRFVHVRSALRKQQAVAKVNEGEVARLKEQEDALSTKLMRAGTTLLVGRLVAYSRCNETLLRNAMLEGLIGRYEPGILSHALLDLLNDEGNEAIFPWPKQLRPSVRIALLSKWIFALCESCYERLAMSLDVSGSGTVSSPLSQVLGSVREHVKNTDTILNLHDEVNQFGTRYEGKDEEIRGAEKVISRPSHEKEAGPIPPYSIERLAF